MKRFPLIVVAMIVAYIACSVASGSGRAFGQQAELLPPSFEVASIKPNKSGDEQMIIRTPPSGLVTATNTTPLMLTRFAYSFPEFRIVDAPKWATSDHFDVTAKASANSQPDQIRSWMRVLLADRFKLQVHTEKRELPVDSLTLVGDGKSAPNLKLREERCDTSATTEPQSSSRPACGMRVGFGQISGVDVTIGDLVAALVRLTNRVVVDKTGLAGRYDFSLRYTPDAVALAPEQSRAQFPAIDPNGPALKTALKEQLGLTIQSDHAPVEVLVIDRLERPEPD